MCWQGGVFDNSRLAQYQQTFKDNLLLAADTFALLGIKTVFEAINTDDMPAFIIHSGEQNAGDIRRTTTSQFIYAVRYLSCQ